jgi:hypothetical protein
MNLMLIFEVMIALTFLYSLVRFQLIASKTVQFIDDVYPLHYSDEYITTMNDRLKAAGLR